MLVSLKNRKIFASLQEARKSENLTPTKRRYCPQPYACCFRDGGTDRYMGRRGASATAHNYNDANYRHDYGYRSDGA